MLIRLKSFEGRASERNFFKSSPLKKNKNEIKIKKTYNFSAFLALFINTTSPS